MRFSIISILLFVSVFAFSQEGYLSTSLALQKYGGKLSDRSFLAFPEVRERPLLWIDSIPEKGFHGVVSGNAYTLKANPGEFFVFQLGIWALRNNASNIKVEFSLFASTNRQQISSSRMTCFNTGGTDYLGRTFTKVVDVAEGQVQPLWLGIDLQGVEKGSYSGSISVISNKGRQKIPVVLEVEGQVVPNHGYDEGKRLSRLYWLNNYTLGVNDEVTKGYTPVEVEGNTVRILGRSLKVGRYGLPETIESYFGQSNQLLVEYGEPVVNKSFRFVVEKDNGEKIYLEPGKLSLTKHSASRAEWSVLSTSSEMDVVCKAQMEFDGLVEYRITVKAKLPFRVKDIRLEVPVTKEKATYMMGLGHEGGLRKPNWKWQWDVENNQQDILWIGAVNGGMRIKLKAENYKAPQCDGFYEFGRLNLPPSWGNENKGGVIVIDTPEGDVLVNAFSGSRSMAKGQELNYDFELLLTPFKIIDREIKFNDRYFQDLPNCPELPDPGYNSTRADFKIELAKKSASNILNLHHDVDIYPFINYPMLDETAGDIKTFVSNAHRNKLRVGLYYSIRLLTVHQPEFWAFNSLDNEILSPGSGNTHLKNISKEDPRTWLLHNMRGRKYEPANYETMEEGKFKGLSDVSVITNPASRLDNFYIGGFDWMVRNFNVDGFFYDETNLNRVTMQRARKILDRHRPGGRLDLHSHHHYSKGWGLNSCLNFYMGLLPYLNYVWIGEKHDYSRLPDYWLIEFSGIPFGLPGQMLWDGGNPWRGMVYGITKREGWRPIEKHSPAGMWKFWDEHSFSKKTMIGYWEKNSPVETMDDLVKATTYIGENEVVVAIGNWSDKDRQVRLQVDWQRLGLDKSKVKITIPEIKDLQPAQSLTSLNELKMPGGKGYLIVIKS
ncbi:glycoside hydrolase domain-containing protein [Agriterribacter sp.]|uniref:glycoside hydrolase domain-containing protein n=1 Tax=Agriterribacter sp. TaxID=2821509 RepID=UPI002CAF1F02|nr:glycoside hydrolase domain-containing protein [Agriterribacter sp.]HRO45902.1 DUF6067 family protein [Agriterribacter sp.]HRO97271.1 DUF6067 family protein [Ferruginibacter sp.]